MELHFSVSSGVVTFNWHHRSAVSVTREKAKDEKAVCPYRATQIRCPLPHKHTRNKHKCHMSVEFSTLFFTLGGLTDTHLLASFVASSAMENWRHLQLILINQFRHRTSIYLHCFLQITCDTFEWKQLLWGRSELSSLFIHISGSYLW